jgi:hypothetical protein
MEDQVWVSLVVFHIGFCPELYSELRVALNMTVQRLCKLQRTAEFVTAEFCETGYDW